MLNRACSFCVLFYLLSFFLARNATADLIYYFGNYSIDQNGHSLTGTLVVSDTAPSDGLLVDAEILSWQFDVSGPRGFSSSSSNVSADVQLSGIVTITETEISMSFPQNNRSVNDLQFYDNNFRSRLAYFRVNDLMGAGVFSTYTASGNLTNSVNAAWNQIGPVMNNASPNHVNMPWIIATAVPEVSGTFVGVLLASAISLFSRRRRYSYS